MIRNTALTVSVFTVYHINPSMSIGYIVILSFSQNAIPISYVIRDFAQKPQRAVPVQNVCVYYWGNPFVKGLSPVVTTNVLYRHSLVMLSFVLYCQFQRKFISIFPDDVCVFIVLAALLSRLYSSSLVRFISPLDTLRSKL